MPNGIRILIQFLIACRENSLPISLTLFRYFFQMRKGAQARGYRSFHARTSFKVITPENNQGWKPRFFFVKNQNWGLREEWNYVSFTDAFPHHSKYQTPASRLLSQFSHPDGRFVREEDLVKYQLSSAPSGFQLRPTNSPSSKGPFGLPFELWFFLVVPFLSVGD